MTERWIEKFRRYKPEPDTLTIWRMGQSGFLLQTQSALICTDLYLSDHPMRTRRSVVRAEELTGLDMITRIISIARRGRSFLRQTRRRRS